jgi:DNA-binding beta-propeller fold protein YncE
MKTIQQPIYFKIHAVRQVLRIVFLSIVLLSLTAYNLEARVSSPAQNDGYELWVIDQSDTTADGGGTLYIYTDDQLEGNASLQPEVIDLGGAARDLGIAQTGTAPRRPHLIFFNGANTHAIIAFLETGHVLFMDARTRTAVGCIDVGEQAAAAVASPDQTFVLVANQNGKLLQRISTNYATNTFTLDDAATLNLATCTTPSGAPCQDPALRPDNAPISTSFDETGRFAFVTLRGGGMFVVDVTATPMKIVAEYDRATVPPNSRAGAQVNGKLYLAAGGGTVAKPLGSDLYAFPSSGFSASSSLTNTQTPKLVFSHDDRGLVDAQGMVLTKNGRFLWVADRAAKLITVVKTEPDTVTSEIDLSGLVCNSPGICEEPVCVPGPDLAPDLMDISPSGNRIFVSLRGPNPLTDNVPVVDNAVGNNPGLAVLGLKKQGKSGVLQSLVPISHFVDGVQQADPHGIAVRAK